MRAGLKLIVLLCFFAAPAGVAAQEGSSSDPEGAGIEYLLEYIDPEQAEDTEQLILILEELSAHPVNINEAGLSELLRVPGLNMKLATGILDYRTEKYFDHLQELREIKEIDDLTYERIHHYVTVGREVTPYKRKYTHRQYWMQQGRLQVYSRYQQDLQRVRGFEDAPEEGGYLGSPGKYYHRFGYTSNHLSINLTQEKDAGETVGTPLRMDHSTWHLAVKENGVLDRLVIGDYGLSFGQGLVLWNGGLFGKGSDATGGISRSGGGTRPYSSAREAGYFRGVAATVGGRLKVTGFYSHQKQTASLIAPDTTRLPRADGYHRTLSEMAQRGTQGQQLWGGRLQITLPFGTIGGTGYRTVFDRPIGSGKEVYNQFDFTGTTNSVIGLDYTLMAGPTVLFGEAGRSQNGAYGIISGVEGIAGPRTEWAFAYRNYSKAFQSFMGNGFSEQSGPPQNEAGFYLGLRYRPSSFLSFSGSMDQYHFPAPRFSMHQPGRGYEWRSRADWQVNPSLNIYLQLRSEAREVEVEQADSWGRMQRKLGEEQRKSFRIQFEQQVNPRVRLRTRGEVVLFHVSSEAPERGYLVYQDVRLELLKGLQADFRITMFDTESYASRLYQYENDMLYVFSTQALHNQGQRIYLLLRYRPHRVLDLWGKAGVTVYEDQQVTGSGLNQLQGDVRSEIGLQVRVRI